MIIHKKLIWLKVFLHNISLAGTVHWKYREKFFHSLATQKHKNTKIQKHKPRDEQKASIKNIKKHNKAWET